MQRLCIKYIKVKQLQNTVQTTLQSRTNQERGISEKQNPQKQIIVALSGFDPEPVE